jgi:hypothetical protein
MAEIKVTEGNLNNSDNLGGSDVSVKITGGGKGALANVAAQPGVLMDAKTNSGILANMEKLAAEIENPWRKLNEGFKDVNAWTSYNKGPAFALREEAANTDRSNLYNIRQQQAAVAAAQQQAQAEAANISRIKQGITGGTGGGAGAGGPNQAQQQLLAVLDTIDPRNVGAQRAAIDEFNKHQLKYSSEAQYNPSAIKQETFFIPGVGDMNMSTNEYNALPADVKQKLIQDKVNRLKGNIPSTTTPPGEPTVGIPGAANLPIVDKNKSLAMPKTDVPLEGLPTPFYGQESSSGKADTSKPGIQGAQGPMQVTKDTFDTYKKKGIIPASYDLNDPGQAYASGVLILNDLHKKHGQDVNKIAAEYFGGSGAINADGSININRQDANGKSVGSYINDIRARMKLSPVELAGASSGPAAAGPSAEKAPPAKTPPPVGTAPIIGSAVTSNIPAFNEPMPNRGSFNSKTEADNAIATWEKRRDAALEMHKKFQEQTGKESAGSFADAEKTFVTLTDQKKIGARQVTTNQLDGWLQRWGENPRVLEILSKPTFANAVADALQQGVTLANAGTLSIPGIERIIQSSMPGLKGDEVTALKQLSSIMGPRILQIVEQSKGSSSDKDWAAFTQIAGNANSGYDFLHKALNYDKASLKADRADRSLYNSLLKPGQPTDFRGFAAHPERDKIYDEYNTETSRISASKFEKQKLPPKPAGMPTNTPAKWSPSTQSYWIGDKEYKVK